ncbi:hypothetical protein D3C79_1065870 [compost metagenome]
MVLGGIPEVEAIEFPAARCQRVLKLHGALQHFPNPAPRIVLAFVLKSENLAAPVIINK